MIFLSSRKANRFAHGVGVGHYHRELHAKAFFLCGAPMFFQLRTPFAVLHLPRFVGLIAMLVVASTLSACGKAKDTHPDQWVTKRRAAFKLMLESLEPLGQVSRDKLPYNAEHFLRGAKDLEELSKAPWMLFPADSNYAPTEANPEVWSQPSEFKAAQDHYTAAVRELVKAAEGGQVDAVKSAVNAVQKSCKACHTQFRSAR